MFSLKSRSFVLKIFLVHDHLMFYNSVFYVLRFLVIHVFTGIIVALMLYYAKIVYVHNAFVGSFLV